MLNYTELGVKNLKTRSVYDNTSLLHNEITFWASETGSYAVAYSGMDGTYQTNRQHFLDFMNQFQVPQKAAANKTN